MFRLAKIINNTTKICNIACGDNVAYYKSQEFTEQDVEQSDKDGCWYLKGYAPMKTDEEKAELVRQERISEIKEELTAIDLKRIRAMCEPSSKTTGQSWLEYYNEQARTLRKELQTLGVSE